MWRGGMLVGVLLLMVPGLCRRSHRCCCRWRSSVAVCSSCRRSMWAAWPRGQASRGTIANVTCCARETAPAACSQLPRELLLLLLLWHLLLLLWHLLLLLWHLLRHLLLLLLLLLLHGVIGVLRYVWMVLRCMQTAVVVHGGEGQLLDRHGRLPCDGRNAPASWQWLRWWHSSMWVWSRSCSRRPTTCNLQRPSVGKGPAARILLLLLLLLLRFVLVVLALLLLLVLVLLYQLVQLVQEAPRYQLRGSAGRSPAVGGGMQAWSWRRQTRFVWGFPAAHCRNMHGRWCCCRMGTSCQSGLLLLLLLLGT